MNSLYQLLKQDIKPITANSHDLISLVIKQSWLLTVYSQKKYRVSGLITLPQNLCAYFANLQGLQEASVVIKDYFIKRKYCFEFQSPSSVVLKIDNDLNEVTAQDFQICYVSSMMHWLQQQESAFKSQVYVFNIWPNRVFDIIIFCQTFLKAIRRPQYQSQFPYMVSKCVRLFQLFLMTPHQLEQLLSHLQNLRKHQLNSSTQILFLISNLLMHLLSPLKSLHYHSYLLARDGSDSNYLFLANNLLAAGRFESCLKISEHLFKVDFKTGGLIAAQAALKLNNFSKCILILQLFIQNISVGKTPPKVHSNSFNLHIRPASFRVLKSYSKATVDFGKKFFQAINSHINQYQSFPSQLKQSLSLVLKLKRALQSQNTPLKNHRRSSSEGLKKGCEKRAMGVNELFLSRLKESKRSKLWEGLRKVIEVLQSLQREQKKLREMNIQRKFLSAEHLIQLAKVYLIIESSQLKALLEHFVQNHLQFYSLELLFSLAQRSRHLFFLPESVRYLSKALLFISELGVKDSEIWWLKRRVQSIVGETGEEAFRKQLQKQKISQKWIWRMAGKKE